MYKGKKGEKKWNLTKTSSHIVAVLDVEVHGYYMDIIVVSHGYHKVLQDIRCFKLL